MGDSIQTKTITVYVQENGIIRMNDTGLLIGRLVDDVTFDELTTNQPAE